MVFNTVSYCLLLLNTHDLRHSLHHFFLKPQGRMLSAWQRLAQERPVPLLCPSSSRCWPHPRGSIPSSSPQPESWHFRSLSSLRPWVPVLVSSVVCICLLKVSWSAMIQKTFHGSVYKPCLVYVAAVIVGGIDMMSQSLVLAKKPHIVIGKPRNDTLISIPKLPKLDFLNSSTFIVFFMCVFIYGHKKYSCLCWIDVIFLMYTFSIFFLHLFIFVVFLQTVHITCEVIAI